MSVVTSKLKNFVKSRKLNVFLIFFILAFFILVLARLSASYTSTVKFNVTLDNIPDEMIVLNDSSNVLNFTMTADGFEWMQYYTKTPSVVIDFKNEIKKIDSLYVWSLSRGYAGINGQFNKDIVVKTINPDTLLFKVDINAVKTIPVRPNLNISYSPGYNVLNTIVAVPDSVKIIGPESLLSKIDVIETEVLNKNDVNKPFSSQLALKLENLESQITVKTKTVNVQVKAEKFTEGTLSLPVNIINIPKNINVNYFPKTINLSYYTSLESYNTIDINDFEVVCDFKEHNSKSTYLSPKLIRAPKAIKTSRLHEQKIEYIISE
ncbi:CdaR family protein [Lacinutrix mariniflava]|uniref:CdaR family protein n=1 Tax=Lacinutrix mariniflava TaxID=342955 RepID=UPI0006E2B008|nr:YbbR-like domain-containing protein [Lacinutrix mariniflava]